MTTPTTKVLPKQIQEQADQMAAFDSQVAADAAAALAPEAPPEPPPTPPAPAPTAPEPAPVLAEQPWEQRYRTLQGVFNSQQASFQAQITDLQAQLAAKPKTPEPAAPTPSTMTAKDTEDFGADLLDVIKRQAAEMVTPIQAKLDEALAANQALRDQLGGVETRQNVSEGERFMSAISAALPNWEVQNHDAGFLGWLAEIDPLTGVSRQTYMDDATSTHNVARTVALFKAFPGYAALAAPASEPAPAAPAVPTPPAPAPSVTPSSSRNDTPPLTPPAEPTWSMAAIEKFYADCGRGMYRGNEAEQTRIENEINAAVATNRLTA